jgi:hypothetical protein
MLISPALGEPLCNGYSVDLSSCDGVELISYILPDLTHLRFENAANHIQLARMLALLRGNTRHTSRALNLASDVGLFTRATYFSSPLCSLADTALVCGACLFALFAVSFWAPLVPGLTSVEADIFGCAVVEASPCDLPLSLNWLYRFLACFLDILSSLVICPQLMPSLSFIRATAADCCESSLFSSSSFEDCFLL